MHKYKMENSSSTVERGLGVTVNHILNMSQQYDADAKIEKLILGHFNRCVIRKTELVIVFLNSPLRSLSLVQFNRTVQKEVRKKKMFKRWKITEKGKGCICSKK